MILQQHKRESGIMKLKRKNYREFQRARQFEGAYEKALKSDDLHHAEYYDRQIDKIFKREGIAE